MSSPRFFVDLPLSTGTSLTLPAETVRHLQVLRLREGDLLTVFNGDGNAYDARLDALEKRSAHATVLTATVNAAAAEPPYRIDLVQGVASNEKMDWLIEKAVELGVDTITPILAHRSVVKLQGERLERRHAHWEALVRAACEQCGRNVIPTVRVPQPFDRWLEATTRNTAETSGSQEGALTPLRWLLSPRAATTFAELPITPPAAPIQLWIGPEGGWSMEEEAAARAAGVTALSLGPRVLRTETAGMAVLAALAGRWGGW
ncbi:16S rRNA methyltransferase [Robbsia andropogonis]|uniref:Ribosomal RNA small subunit methyltransferase E n=1 Tax=Robbsia andropogonis TaxID=28092 RepID=A0A0F5JZE2_9BURK|nr:16S rRNA (uracil(1498)-N(3))-methyltransferase [Robbsia andropogonis]KKB63035.1 16S rRNA methyltransferase [Robbsia andropogonis]MCP1118334.1 16S rRNA (uracil(1498)-N(3))-methyltransferase [Robbsia andropogonis]MCP1127887.1 16S rRNA (uracil(1498)-N(3))-methyltransferase [Robbsia andropogonis]